MGKETIIKHAVEDVVKKGGVSKEDVAKGGGWALLLGIIIWLGSGTLEQQKEMTKAINDGNAAMQSMASAQNHMSQQLSRAVDKMAEATAAMNARE
jgi:methyl-accepting chemotaxis protein